MNMASNKICFVICWFGRLPDYLPVWLKSCARNPQFDYLLLTDDDTDRKYPANVKYIPFSAEAFLQRVRERLDPKPSLKKAYRLCDYRPMYGILLEEELRGYQYWGYCDIDLVFGDVGSFLPMDEIMQYEAVFNGGHFTLLRNTEKINHLFMQPGSLFNYKTVVRRHAIFAFDETTGIQRIAREQNIKAGFGIPYIETESKYSQLRSRMEKTNPDLQAFYWENGELFRVKADNDVIWYQKIAYIHLQKRKIKVVGEIGDSFWICPWGYEPKEHYGVPCLKEIAENNPLCNPVDLKKQDKEYKKKKIIELLKRNPFQIYVRMRQQFAGINANDGAFEEREWKQY